MGHGLPRSVIPAAWAKQGCCPVCQAAKLNVRQTPGAPDQMVCAQCGCAFELEAGGSRLALTEGPPALAAAIGGTTRIWLSFSEVRGLLQPPPTDGASTSTQALDLAGPKILTGLEMQAAAPRDGPVALPDGLAHCTEADLLQRAEALLALGNSPLQIQVALVQSGVAPELVQRVVETTRLVAEAKRQRQLRWTWVMTGLIVACLVVAIGLGWGFWYQARAASPAATPGTAQTPGAPTLTGVAGFLLSLPTSVVQTEPPPAPAASGVPPVSGCPTSPSEAASLFGGKAGDWTYKADAGGWLMTAVSPQTIYIPAGMLAGYLQFGEGGANMNQVDGPAKIQNVNFIAITCP